MNSSRSLTLSVALVAAIPALAGRTATAAPLPERVTFAGADGRTTLVGYVFTPDRAASVAHACGGDDAWPRGAYPPLAKGKYDASTLSKASSAMGTIWAKQGYLAILVDGFGPRGYPTDFRA